MVKVQNSDELKAWLADQDADIAAVIAGRAALRVAPVLLKLTSGFGSNLDLAAALFIMRAALNSLLVGTWDKADVQSSFFAADQARLYKPRSFQGSTNATVSDTTRRAMEVALSSALTATFVTSAYPYRYGRRDADHAAADTVVLAAPIGLDAWVSVGEDVARLSEGMTAAELKKCRLFSDDTSPNVLNSARMFIAALLNAREFGFEFWHRWYQSIISGSRQNWAMLQQIVLIDEEFWVAGPEAVAGQIAIIEASYALEPIPKTILREQVTVLIKNASIAQISGNSLALQIEDAITAYLREEECNGLPDELSVLEHLPAALRRITSAVSVAENDESRVEDLELSIQVMASEIQTLEDQLETLQSAPTNSPFLKALKEQSGKSLGDWKMWGALISGSYLLLGEPAAGTTLAHITETLKSLIGKPQT